MQSKEELLDNQEMNTYLGGLVDSLHMSKDEVKKAIKIITEDE